MLLMQHGPQARYLPKHVAEAPRDPFFNVNFEHVQVRGKNRVDLSCRFSQNGIQTWGVLRYPDAGKSSTKNVIVTPLFVRARPKY